MRFIFFLFASLSLAAGEPANTISGVVTDPSNQPVPAARIECNGNVTLSDPQGRFTFSSASGCGATIAHADFQTVKTALRAGGGNRIQLPLAGLTESVLVTAARTTTTPEEAGVAASVITSDEIRARGYPQLPDLLRETPGVNIAQSGRPGSIASIFTRGGNSTGTLVLLDGVPVSDPGGQINIANLVSEGLDRVEVVRGPESALFGAEAAAGVIQLFTARGNAEDTIPHGSFSWERGNFQTDRTVANVAGGYGSRLDYALNAVQFHTVGEYVNDYDRDTSGTANLGFRISGKTQVRAIFREYDSHAGTPDQVGFGILDTGANEEARDSLLSLRVDDTRGPHYFHSFTFGYHRLNDSFFDTTLDGPFNVAALVRDVPGPSATPLTYLVSLLDPNNLPPASRLTPGERIVTNSETLYPFPSVNITGRDTAGYQGAWTHTGGALIFGYDYQHQRANVNDINTFATRDNNGLYLFEQRTIARRFYLSGGIRYEHSSAYGDEVAPRGAASVLLAGEHGALSSTFLRFSAGRGVTEPSLYDTYVKSPYFSGNPSLKPEVTRSYEAGLVQEWFGKRLRTEVNAFRNSFDNLIVFTAANTFQNIAASWAHGVEITARAHLGAHIMAQGTYMRLYTRVTNSLNTGAIGEQLPRRPLNSGSLALYITPRRWSFAAGATFSGEIQDVDFLFGLNRNTGYENVFAGASYSLNRYASLTLRGANLLNQRYQEVLGYPALSRSVIGGVRLGW